MLQPLSLALLDALETLLPTTSTSATLLLLENKIKNAALLLPLLLLLPLTNLSATMPQLLLLTK
jgi:hypothetical protein